MNKSSHISLFVPIFTNHTSNRTASKNNKIKLLTKNIKKNILAVGKFKEFAERQTLCFIDCDILFLLCVSVNITRDDATLGVLHFTEPDLTRIEILNEYLTS